LFTNISNNLSFIFDGTKVILFYLLPNFLTKKNPELFEFRTYGYIVYYYSTLYYTKSLSPELVCEIRGYEQLLNCCFQIETFICLLVFFIFLFFVVFLPCS
jgi:hypothetical protein